MKKNLLLNGMALFACLVLFAGTIFAQTTNTKTVRIEYGGVTTWTVPDMLDGNPITVTSVTFEAWGGGGAGGFCESGSGLTPKLSGGGGGGAYGRTVISNPDPGETFNFIIGQGGYNRAESDGALVWAYKNHEVADGGQTVVKRESNIILEANGGKTCAMNTGTGALGGAATGIGDLHKAGGNGGNAKTDCTLPGRRSSGGGGGAGYAGGNGGYGGNGICDASNGGGTGGTSGGAGGNGGNGVSNISVGKSGTSFGGGGGGSKSGEAWHSGGGGANGGILITYTYTATALPSITVNNAETTICSGTEYDVILDVTLINVDPTTVTLIPAAVGVTGLSFASPTLSYEGSEFHLKGTATNSTSGTLTANMTNCKLKAGSVESDAFTFTLNVYGKLDPGIIAEEQFVCHNQTIQTLTSVADATGGSGNGSYEWWQWVTVDENINYVNGPSWEIIDNANASTYTPTLEGLRYYMRVYVDDVCGMVYDFGNYLQVTTVNPYVFNQFYAEDITICPNENYDTTLTFHYVSPSDYSSLISTWGVYWQKSEDKGNHWEDLTSLVQTNYELHLTPSDYPAGGGDLWYRVAVKLNDCDSFPSNAIYKIHVKEIPSLTVMFQDVDITLWYGACDTNVANLPAPEIDDPYVIAGPFRTDGLVLTPNDNPYELTWIVSYGCGITQTYTQNVTVKYPDCPTMNDANGYDYQTVRIGCDCWLAENLKTNATDAAYYEEDEANKDFGKLYTWQAAVGSNNTEKTTMAGDTYIQGVCPDGWAIPTVAQFNTMLAVAGTVEDIMSDDQDAWLPGYAGTNTSGFGAKGAGYYESMTYQRQLGYTYFWTSELNSTNTYVAKTMELRCGCGEFTCIDKNKEDKLSVRCVRVQPYVETPFVCGTDQVKDIEKNVYYTVKVGDQCWTRPNMRNTTYADGSTIANAHNDPFDIAPVYGYLYNWDAVSNTAGICPKGWHVGTKAEWQTLLTNGTKAIAADNGWLVTTNANQIGYDQENTNNSTGFSAYPAGQYNGTSYQSLYRIGTIWTSTESGTNTGWNVTMNALMNTANGLGSAGYKNWGKSVRCIRDNN